MAKALTTFFVFRNFGVLEGWNEGTCIAEVVPLYGNDDAIKAYRISIFKNAINWRFLFIASYIITIRMKFLFKPKVWIKTAVH